MKKFSSSASLSNNNNCNSNYYCSSKSNTSAKITNKLIANQITNDIIKPKAISAAEAKLKNTNKNYAKISSSQTGECGGSVAYKIYNRQEIDTNGYSMHLQQPGTSSTDVLSCISTNSSSDSSSTLNVCEYEAVTSAAAAAAASSSSSSALNSRKKSIVNDYATADYVMHRPKSSQSQHNSYCKSPAEKSKQHHRSKHYSAHGTPRSQHSTGSGPIYAKKHQHSKKSTHHHNHAHKQAAAQYTPTSHSLHMSSTPPSLPPSPPPPLRLSTAKIDRHS